jgi:hypothetical protein
MLLLDGGRIVADGSPSALLKSSVEMIWLPAELVSERSFVFPNDFVALSSSLNEIAECHHGHSANPFRRRG